MAARQSLLRRARMLNMARVTGGNPEAAHFLTAWNKYLRRVDDAVDQPDMSAENLLTVFAMGESVYSSNFYRRHIAQLQMPILVCTSLWMVANEWEAKDQELWKRKNADVLRNADMIVVNAVTQVCAGWMEAFSTTKSLLAAAYVDHKDRHGVPE